MANHKIAYYNCRHAGDSYRITKFDADWNVESSYLCTFTECECPAGIRDICRHRQMLPKFIANGHVDDGWSYNFDHDGWVMQVSVAELASEPIEAPAPELFSRRGL
jgi:hypothetical protein